MSEREQNIRLELVKAAMDNGWRYPEIERAIDPLAALVLRRPSPPPESDSPEMRYNHPCGK